jgi:hypothetical protein
MYRLVLLMNFCLPCQRCDGICDEQEEETPLDPSQCFQGVDQCGRVGHQPEDAQHRKHGQHHGVEVSHLI